MKRWYRIILFELVGFILISLSIFLNYEETKLSFSTEQMMLQDKQRDLQEGFYADTSNNGYTAVVTPVFSLDKGIYYIDFTYEGSGIVRGGIIYDIPHKSQEVVANNESIINTDRTNTLYRLQINDTSDIRFRLRLTGDAVDGDYILLRNVTIMSSKLTWIRTIVVLAFVFVACNLLVIWWHHLRRCNPENRLVEISLGILCFILGLPLYREALIGGVDLSFHMWRIEGICEGLLSGQFPVRIQPGWLDGHGYATSIFYGDIFLYFPAILYLIGFSLQDAYKIFITVLNIGTVFISFYSFKRLSGNSVAALTGTVLYSGCIDRLFRLYGASRVGMVSAMAFYPLIVLGMYMLLSNDVKKESNKKSWLYLAIGFTGLLMTHIISCLIVGIFVVLCCIVFIKRFLQRNALCEVGKALLSFVLVNLWFLVPFIHYMGLGKVRVFADKVISEDYYLELAGFAKDSRTLSEVFMEVVGSRQGIGYALTLVLILFILACAGDAQGNLIKKNAGVFGFSILSLWFATDLFPAVWIAKISKLILKMFKIIQYQERFLAVTTVLIATLAVLLVATPCLKKEISYLAAIMLIAFSMYQNMEYFSSLEANVVYIDKMDLEEKYAKHEYEYGVGNGEYIPIGTDVSSLTDEICYDGKYVSVGQVERNYLNYQITATNSSESEQNITLPLLFYDGYWCEEMNSHEVMEVVPGDNVCVSVILPAGFQGTVEVKFVSPWFWRLAEVISLLGTIGMAVYFIRGKYWAKEAAIYYKE